MACYGFLLVYSGTDYRSSIMFEHWTAGKTYLLGSLIYLYWPNPKPVIQQFFYYIMLWTNKHSNLPGDLLNTLRRFRCFDQLPIKDYYSTQAFLASLNTEKNSGAKNVYYCILTSGFLALVHHLWLVRLGVHNYGTQIHVIHDLK